MTVASRAACLRPAPSAVRAPQRNRKEVVISLQRTFGAGTPSVNGAPSPSEEIELWAWFAAYDHVALCQLWGAMPALPRPIPRFTRELRQRWDDLGQPALPPKPTGTHDALVDARYNLARWEVMEAARPR